MIKLGKLIVCLILMMIAGAIIQNGFTYYVYGGYKGGWFSTAWIAIAHFVGIAACLGGIKFIWTFQE